MDAVRTIARTVLYEGYLLWPYRRSALKNQHRFTIGGLYPAEYAATSADRARACVDLLLEGVAPHLDTELRFLRLWRRQAMLLGEPVDELVAGGERYVTWDDATEESVTLDGRDDMREGTRAELRIERAARTDEEPLAGGASLRRSAEPLSARLLVETVRLDAALHRVTVSVTNLAAWDGSSRDEALRRALLAAHVVLRVRDGAFVSAIDPPDAVREYASTLRSEGLWPVLVGDAPDRATLLAAPMILEDYPRVAPESAGDYFDGGEIDELLVHSIRALTDEEQAEMRATDPHARELLERTLAMSPTQLARLHGAVRDMKVPP